MADTKTLAAFAWSGHCVYGSRAAIDAVIALLKIADEVKRLREPGRGKTEHEAADEITRLREENYRLGWALEEIIQSADQDDADVRPAVVQAWYCISTHLIDQARASLNIHKRGD